MEVKIIADSVSMQGKRITTFEMEYPRIINAELLTHKMFSLISASSRAIPVDKLIDVTEDNPFIPKVWTSNQRGMQGGEPLEGYEAELSTAIWKDGLAEAVTTARQLGKRGVHKQYANRGLETYSNIKTVLTATEFDNFFVLRDHPDAQPEFQELAQAMKRALEDSTPEELKSHEWHTPYVAHSRDELGGLIYGDGLSVEEAKMVSTSCCDQVSYRNLNDSLDKAIELYHRLHTSRPIHGSPFEHCARAMVEHSLGDSYTDPSDWENGVTHMDSQRLLWSGNFKGWIQLRNTIKE